MLQKYLGRFITLLSTLFYTLSYVKLDARINVCNGYILLRILYAVTVWYHLLLAKDQKSPGLPKSSYKSVELFSKNNFER